MTLCCVCASATVARIRFQSAHYTVSEDSPRICVPVENMAPPTSSDFAVSFSFGESVRDQCRVVLSTLVVKIYSRSPGPQKYIIH